MNEGRSERRISPRAFLKARRPKMFSDSVAEEITALDRSILEYHLETITSRSQETDFEHFVRKLVQFAICPNLLPHTGPSGGGDSKVDAETYPVSDALSLVWFNGIGREAAQERWAFAFSAKKEWRPKLKSDVAKIKSTTRDYRKAFFVTNQFVPDRSRAEVEDELSQKHGLDVRVFDRTWILNTVFEGHHETLAIDELKLSASIRTQQQKGPLDLHREGQLKTVEARITQATEQRHFGPPLVDDCLEAVQLARGMELPRIDVDGRLLRAKRVAQEYGTAHQKLLAAYQWTWTAFWWFEDFKIASEQYSDAEKYAIDSTNAYELELLFNLWCTLQMATTAHKTEEEASKLKQRTQLLTDSLERVQQNKERISNSLQAETLKLLMDLVRCPPEKSDPLLKKCADVIDRSEGLLGFPLEPLIEVLTEFGSFVSDRPAYDSLHDKLVETVAQRTGQVAAAHVLLRRGAQMLDTDRPYLAVKSLGKALMRLYKHESRADLVKALYLCGNAYAEIDLKWAARGTLLMAASIATNEFWTYQDVTPSQAACFNRLKWLELQLGRLPSCLAWHEVSSFVNKVLQDRGIGSSSAMEDEVWFDGCLPILILRSDLRQLRQMTRLPRALEELELPISTAALRFALGHEYDLPEALNLSESEKKEFFDKLSNQPAGDQMPDSPSLSNQRRVTLKSRLLGCNLVVEADNEMPCIELGESILAGLEALLATGLEYRFFAHQSNLLITVRRSDFGISPFKFEIHEECGEW